MRRNGILVGIALAACAASSRPGRSSRKAVRLVGKITAVDGSTLAVKTAQEEAKVSGARQCHGVRGRQGTFADVKKGDYIGVGAMPQADGSQKAIRVNIFAEPQRGAGEGFRPWDRARNHDDQCDRRHHGDERRRQGGDGEVQGWREEDHHRSRMRRSSPMSSATRASSSRRQHRHRRRDQEARRNARDRARQCGSRRLRRRTERFASAELSLAPMYARSVKHR